jgi:Predicted nucleic acid-binding protein, contains PIN domain
LAKLSNYEHYVSIITHTEIYAGKSIWEDKNLGEIVAKMFSGFEIKAFDTVLSQKAGKIRAHYQTSLADSIIAATAIENNCELVTLNMKDFKKISGLKLFEGK